ncbi:ROK family protein [Paenibacillus allorhizosphaerae]|uniref:N-acetylglucosamine repressor n=1 Tax=Paenibacillus allorhizosphaerae TaxID=2849866 RepID=A0ABM8VKT1_9BACL|nr:ROK family transcriptional regulator [Paenibacillus allorhizosphaerae]CAG7647601.1 N-acetylglucosamine repressor [Paenibacillus allorhizosphaerae]
MKQTGDLNLVKKINKSIVLQHIRSTSPVSRARLAELTGLTKATVSSLVAELIESRLVDEIGAGESSGGRKPVMLLFNGTAGYAVGVDLGINYIWAALTDLNGNTVEQYRLKHNNTSVESVIADLIACIREVAGRAPDSAYGIVGIGIGIPGFSDERGNVLFAPNLGWENVPLQQLIEQEFAIPVVIDNEANAGAVGEKQFGAGQEAAHLVYVSIGMGIGTGIIIKDELFRGSSGFSGEMGHISIQYDGKPCRCGNAGCWELYASENALLEQARAVMPGGDVSVETLIRLAEEGDLAAIECFERLGRYLGIGIVNIINSFNPELIVIGGRLAEAERWLRGAVHEVVERRSLPYPRAQLQVQFSALGAGATVLGACSFAIGKFFASTKVSVE